MPPDRSIDDFKRKINAEPAMRRWAGRTQARNLQSLHAGQGPGGAPLAPNRPYTIRRKGHARVGFGKTEQMAAGLVAAAGVNLRIGGSSAEATVFAGPGGTDAKVNIFIRGQPERAIQKQRAKTKRGKRMDSRSLNDPRAIADPNFLANLEMKAAARGAWRILPPVPGRDFIGIDPRDVDAAADDLTTDVFRQWGFK